MIPKRVASIVLSLSLLVAATAFAKTHERARISMRRARAIAAAEVPGGKIQSSELEREHGMLIYSFDIRVPHKPGIEEVQVDAIKGGVVSKKHESPAAERKEAKKEHTGR